MHFHVGAHFGKALSTGLLFPSKRSDMFYEIFRAWSDPHHQVKPRVEDIANVCDVAEFTKWNIF